MSITLNDVVSPNNTSVMNANFQKIEDAINNEVVKRVIEAGEANEMHTHSDMNQNKIVNVAEAENPNEVPTYGQLTATEASAGASAVSAAASASSAAGSASVAGEAALYVSDTLEEALALYADYGLISSAVDDEDDYGSIG